jgi:large subunit ribosomal protein L6
MSRIGKQPVPIPAGVKVTIKDGKVTVAGPKASKPLEFVHHRNIKVALDDAGKVIHVTRPDDERLSKALHGLTRSIVANMVEGATKGYQKKLQIVGVGYQAKLAGKSVTLTVGFANPITLTQPDGVVVLVPDANTILVQGADKQQVGQFAAEVRHVRPPEPYQGKGIKYENEQVRRKEGKSFASGG